MAPPHRGGRASGKPTFRIDCRARFQYSSGCLSYREAGLRAGKVGLQVRAEGSIANEGEVRRRPKRHQNLPQYLQVLLCRCQG